MNSELFHFLTTQGILALLFCYNYNIEIATFSQINSSLFKDTHSIFYSCNTATGRNNSFRICMES